MEPNRVAHLLADCGPKRLLDGAATGVRTRIRLVGSFKVNAAGTIIPQITFSADPTGALTTNIGSYFRCFPIGHEHRHLSRGVGVVKESR
jgi:hypothetical protein